MRPLRTAARASLALTALALAATPLLAQTQAARATDAVRSEGAAPVLTARATRAERAPQIDGREDDPVWATAAEYDDFVEFQPTEGKAPRFRTTFKVAFDDRNLYVFARAFDPHPDSIMTALSRRDVRGPSDQLKIMVDAYNDRRSGFQFAVNPVGVKRDYSISNDVEEDDSWDGIWDVGTRIDSVGWTAEFRIPLSQLRYENRPTHTFGFGVWRDIERYKERTAWPAYRQGQNTLASQFGRIEGIAGIRPFERLEVTPYAVAKSSTMRRTSPVASWDHSERASMGADIKYGITPNLTLDATVNPDFGQVQADPSVLNLSAFEAFYQERRPFFIEGTGLYRYQVNCNVVNCGGEGMFYSRRIGRAPQLLGQYGDDASPAVTPILGAAKLTGRLPGGFNVGVLEALTDRVYGMQERTTEPRTNYAVLRATKDLRSGESGIGVIATAVNRSLDEWTEEFLRSDAYATGLNVRHRFAGKRYEVTGSVMGSLVRGSAEAIRRTQLNGVHNFQRPDDDVVLDETRTSLGGHSAEATFGKIGGQGVMRFQTSYMYQSPGFELNDLGYLRRADQQGWANWMGLSYRKPTKAYRQMNGNFNYWANWTYGGLQTQSAFNTNWHVNLKNFWWVHAGGTISQLPGTYCDNCSRGGPAVRRSPFLTPWIGFEGDDRKRIVPYLWFNFGRGDYGASNYFSVSPEAELRLRSNLQVFLGMNWERNDDDSQWFDNFTDEATGATHYTVARLEQRTLSLSTRWNYTMTPTLSLQVYAAPFLSRGQYSKVRELSATPRAARYADRYQAFTPPDDTDMGFDFKQLRSNTVLRWEFRPGSTLFAVWTHGRDDYVTEYSQRSWGANYKDLFALHPSNTFLVKMAYWLNR